MGINRVTLLSNKAIETSVAVIMVKELDKKPLREVFFNSSSNAKIIPKTGELKAAAIPAPAAPTIR